MRLIDDYDAALFDLDGVLYLGPRPVDGAAEAVAGVRESGKKVAFVTNNASRTPEAVASHLTELGIEASPDDVVTSAQAIADVMAKELPTGTRVLIVGAPALADEISRVGFTPVASMADDPQAVVMGYNPQWRIKDLQECCVAVHAGLPYYASNLDLTIPSDRGIFPGMGTWVNVIEAATGTRPLATAGKPARPLLDATVARLGCERPIFVGDRLDTDIEGANVVGMDSLFVLSGAHTREDLAKASQIQQPTFVGDDARALLHPGAH